MDVDVHVIDDSDDEELEDNAVSESEDSEADDEQKLVEAKKLEQLMKQGHATNTQLLKLVYLLSDVDEIVRARECREVLYSKFSLSEQDWLSWLDDELELHKSVALKAGVEERSRSINNLFALFDRATHEYKSPRIWCIYMETLQLNLDEETVTVDRLREVFERAVEQVGMNAADAYTIRKSYRDFEMLLLEQLAESDAEANGASGSTQKAEQIDRIQKLFRRELRVPHMQLDDNIREYREFRATWCNSETGTEAEAEAERLFNEAKRAFGLIADREALAAELEEPELAQALHFWSDYVAFVRADDSSAFSRSYPIHLYERALCAISDLLIDEESGVDHRADGDCIAFVTAYLDYLESELRDRERYRAVLDRATRLCYSSSTLWCRRLRDAERRGADKIEMCKLCETALGRPLATADSYKDVWQTYLDYLRRRVFSSAAESAKTDDTEGSKVDSIALEDFRNAAQRGVDFVNAIGADVYRELTRDWAACEARAGCLQQAREIWRVRLFQCGFDKMATYCVEHAELERRFADARSVRAAFSKALHTVTDYPHVIDDAFLRFEREEGNLDSFCKTLQLVEQMRVQRARRAAAEAASQAASATKRGGKKEVESRKRKGQDRPEASDSAKRTRFVASGTLASVQSGKESQATDDYAVKAEGNESGDRKEQSGTSAKQKRIEHDSSKDEMTVFVSNLPFTADENTIKTEFEKCGAVTDIRLVRDSRGRSKGYAYVQFANTSSRSTALARDRSLLNGRPMFVSPCDPSRSSTAAFRFANGLEPCKLFVRNLPLTVTQQAVEKIFSEYGQLRAVRLVTFRNGRPKGIAYVEYCSQEAASRAVISADELLVGDRQISVALSDPSVANGERRTLTDFLREKREGKYLRQLGAEGDDNDETERNDQGEGEGDTKTETETAGNTNQIADSQTLSASETATTTGAEKVRQQPQKQQQPPDTRPKPKASVFAFAPRVSTVASKRIDLGIVMKRGARPSPDTQSTGSQQSSTNVPTTSSQQTDTAKPGDALNNAKLSNDQFRKLLFKQ